MYFEQELKVCSNRFQRDYIHLCPALSIVLQTQRMSHRDFLRVKLGTRLQS